MNQISVRRMEKLDDHHTEAPRRPNREVPAAAEKRVSSGKAFGGKGNVLVLRTRLA